MARAGCNRRLRNARLESRHTGVERRQKRVVVERPEPRFGVVTAILYCEDSPSVMIEDQMLHKGDVIHDVKVLDIKADKVQFDKQGEQWEQGVQEPAKPEWWKRSKGKEKIPPSNLLM